MQQNKADADKPKTVHSTLYSGIWRNEADADKPKTVQKTRTNRKQYTVYAALNENKNKGRPQTPFNAVTGLLARSGV